MCPPPERPAHARAPGPAGGRRRGFTLVELLVSLALLALVMTLVYAAFEQISGPALAQRDELTEHQELRLLVRMIADDLQSAQWLARYAEKGPQYRSGIVAAREFQESKEFSRVAMHTAGPARFHRGFNPARDPRLHEVGYFVRLSEDRSALELVRREDFYLDDDLEHDGLEVVLTQGVETFRVEFLPPGAETGRSVGIGPGTQETWEESWDSPNRPAASRMPLAIRVTVARKGTRDKAFSESLEFNLSGSLKL